MGWLRAGDQARFLKRQLSLPVSTMSHWWVNVALAPIRSRVERAFGTLKRSYGWRRVRYPASPATAPTCTCSAARSTCAAPNGWSADGGGVRGARRGRRKQE